MEENAGRALLGKSSSSVLQDLLPQEKEIKAKINKLDSTKLKRFGTAKETTSKTKEQSTEWEKIFVNDAANWG